MKTCTLGERQNSNFDSHSDGNYHSEKAFTSNSASTGSNHEINNLL